jgi:hypothetical protein
MCAPVQRQDFEADFGLVLVCRRSGFPCFRGSSGSGAHKAAVTGWSEQSEQCRQCKHEGSVAGGGAVVCDSCGSAGVSAATVSGESVVAVGVDREDRIVARKVGCAQRVPWSEVCEGCVT